MRDAALLQPDVVEADLPGVAKGGVEISVENNLLTLIARRVKAEPPGDAVSTESVPADYRRVFELEPAIDPSGIAARLDQGVLTITLPKHARAKSRKIELTD